MNDKIAINPFHVGAEFLNYCIKQGWIELEMAEDKRLHYYVTDIGAKELYVRYGMSFNRPCALEKEDQ